MIWLKSTFKIVCGIICLLTYAGTCFAVDTIRWNHGKYNTDKRRDFKIELLIQVMDRTAPIYGPYVMVESDRHRVIKRAIQQVNKGEYINIFMAVTSPEWERNTIPIRIPIRRGILNYRLLTINKSNQAAFAKITSLNVLKTRTAGLRKGWATVGVMKQLDMKVSENISLAGLFEMLCFNRIDYIPRGINEAYDEVEQYGKAANNLVVEPTIALYSQAPYYIFVSPHEERLAKRIKEGLEMMIEDGSHKALFDKFYAEKIKRANLPSRHIIEIKNTLLSPETPLERKELWFEYDDTYL